MLDTIRLLFCQYRKIFTVIILAIFFNFNLANQTSAHTASMSVVGGHSGISLDIPYTSSGMQKNETKPENLSKLLIKSDSAAGWELHLEATDLVVRGTDQKLTLYTQPTQSWDWSIPYVANIWGICSPRSKGEYGDLIEYFFNQDKTYTAIKTGIPTEADGFTYEFGIYTHTNGKSLGGNYQGNLTFSLIANEETTTNFVNGRTFNHALREATEETDLNTLNHPESEITASSKIQPFTFSDKSPENALKTVKISTDNSERPVYLSTVKNGEYYYPTIWTTANRLIMNEDSSYMFSGLTTVKDSTFRNWKNVEYRIFDFSKVKSLSYFFYKNNKNSSRDKISENLIELISHANPTNLDSMFEETNLYQSRIKINTTGPVSTRAMFKKAKESIYPEGNFLANSYDLTSAFEGSELSFNYSNLENFGINTISTKDMYKDAYTQGIDFTNANFQNLTTMEGMFDNFRQYSVDNLRLPKTYGLPKLTNMARMFNNLRSSRVVDLTIFNTENTTDMSYLFGSDGRIENKLYNNVTHVIVGEQFSTKNVTNMAGMFAGAHVDNIAQLIDKFDTSKVTNMAHFLDNTKSITSINLKDNINTENVTDMSYMFANHDPLGRLILGNNFSTKNVVNMEGMFKSINDLEQLNLGDKFDTYNVTNMRYTFAGIDDLAALDLGAKFDTSKVIDMSYMFENTNEMVTLNLGDKFDTSNVTNMDHMFSRTGYLRALDFKGKLDTHKVTNMDHMFYASGVKTLDLGMNFNTSVVTSMASMFESSAVKDLTFPIDMGDAPNLTDVKSMFKGCSGLVLVNPFNLDTRHAVNMASMFESASASANNEYVFGDKFNLNETTSTEKMFYKSGAKKITFSHFNAPKNLTAQRMFAESLASEIIIPELNMPEVKDMSYMFHSSRIRVLNLPEEINTPKLENMYWMFRDTNELDSISHVNFDTRNVTNMEDLFVRAGTKRRILPEIILGPKFVLTKVQITKGMFYDSRPKKIVFSSFNAPELVNMDRMFAYCSVQELNLSNDIDTPKLEIANQLFMYTSSLAKINEINFSFNKVTNMNRVFAYMGASNGELEFNIGSKFNPSEVTDMSELFIGSNIKNITFNSFDVPKLKTMKSMFAESNIKKVSFATFDAPNLETMERMFEKSKVQEVNFPDSTNTPKLVSIYAMFSNANGFSDDYNLNLPLKTENLENMGYAFYYFTGQSVNLSTFNTHKVSNLEYLFKSSKVKEINLANKNFESVVSMSHSFSNCQNLTNLNLSGVKTSNKLNTMYATFASSTMEILDLSGFDTSGVNDVSYLFKTAPNIKTIYVSEKFIIKPSASDSYPYMFESDTNLVGGQGTTYNSSYMRKEYARIDDPSNGKPGYFTYKAAP